MTDPTTPNLGLAIPLRGADLGVWDVPANGNFNILDSALGGSSSMVVTNTNFTLSTSQAQSVFLIFTGTQTGNVTVSFPAARGGVWMMQNLCTNTSFFLKMTMGVGGQDICLPNGEPVLIMSDGTNLKFLNLGRIGEYMDIAVNAIPVWITNCTVAPYLNCDGSTFNATTYPILNSYLGGNTLPDSRGRLRYVLNQGTSRMTSKINANTLLASGGAQTLAQADLPNFTLNNTLGVTDPGHVHAQQGTFTSGAENSPLTHVHGSLTSTIFVVSNASGLGVIPTTGPGTALGTEATTDNNASSLSHTHNMTISGNTVSNTTGITLSGSITSGGSNQGFTPPGYVGGLTLIRAA